MNIKVKDIVKAAEGILLCGDGEQIIEHISIDSRSSQGNDIFVPIIGEKVDAHRFISQAFENGCAAALTSEHTTMDDTRPWIYVKDTIEGLHAIGRLCRSRVAIPAVGITGSVGKTTTREMVATALSAEKKIFKTSKNYNSRVGLPITLSEMTEQDDMAVLELGMNVPGELGTISRLAGLDMAVITNIGVAHIEYFGTQDKICQEKLTITQGLKPGGLLFLNGDDPYLMKYKDQVKFPVVTYGTGEHCDYRAVNIHMEQGHYCFSLIHGAQNIPVMLSVLGIHNVVNAAGALAVADRNGVSMEAAAKALTKFTGFQNRLQVFRKNGYTIIDDTYNASPASMKAGLIVLTGMDEPGKKYAVLGDMFELGNHSPAYHYEVGEFAATLSLDGVFLVGEMSRYIENALTDNKASCQAVHFESKEELAAKLKSLLTAGDTVYLKASNGMKLKEVTAMLLENGQHV